MNLTHILFNPHGRIGQREFWVGVLILLAGNIVAGMIPVLGELLWLGLIWVGVAVYGKRLHDGGRTAWLHAIPWAVSSVLGIIAVTALGAGVIQLVVDGVQNGQPSPLSIGGMAAAGGVAMLMMTTGTVVWAVYTLWVGLLKGEAAANRHGPVPIPPAVAEGSAA
jgi:uncharacterized membrane protein YhaH (DUF805 family)